VPPVIKPDDEVKEGQEMMSNAVLSENLSDDLAGTEVVAEKIEVKEIAQEEEQVFQAVEQMPTFPGGNEELGKYLGKNVVYPASAQENGIQGTVYVSFVVDKNGRISDVKVLRSVDTELDKEAIRVIKSMPAWIAGKQNGVPVRVAFTVPVKFVLQ
jgi:protein TonB